MINFYLRHLLSIFSFLLLVNNSWAVSEEDSLLIIQRNNFSLETRQFFQLNDMLKEGRIKIAPVKPDFTEEVLRRYDLTDTGTAASRAKAQQTLEEIERSNHYIDFISPAELADLPVGLKKKLGNTDFIIGISKTRFMGSYTLLTVFCKVKLPQNKEIFFGADNIKLSDAGGMLGNAQLVLLGDFSIPFNGGNLLLTLKGGQSMSAPPDQYQTYAKLECDGLKEIGIEADVLFPQNMLVPLNPDYTQDKSPSAKVKGSFSTIVTDWNDILAEFSMKPFAIKGLERFAISIDKAVFDFSDVRNSLDVAFPAGYEGLPPGNEALWRGVYVSKLRIILPKEFKKRGSTERVSFEANQMLVDNMGLTGNFIANDVLSSGSASGWEFSVDKFSLDIRANHLKAAGFEGYIALPLNKRQQKDSLSKTAFGYTAIISPGNQYLMRVKTLKDLNFNVWQARAQLDSGSYVELLVRDDQFRPKAVLNGSMSIEVIKQRNAEPDSTAKPLATIKGLVFQRLILQTEGPFLQADYFGYKGDAKLANFPISLYDIGLTANSRDAALGFGVRVNLMNGKLTANSKLKIIGELVSDNDVWNYNYKRTEIERLEIVNGDFGGFTISGFVDFNRNHPIMGNGFAGSITMKVKLIKEISITAKAAFGSSPAEPGKSDVFRYWYVDALTSGFDIRVGGAFSITALGGGASYHMRKMANIVADTSISPTRLNFIPDREYGLGFRGSVGFKVQSEKACHGEAGLEMLFTNNWGMANIGLYGKAFFFSKGIDFGMDSMMNKIQRNLADFTRKVTGIDSAKVKQSMVMGKFTDIAPLYATDVRVGGEGSISAYVGIQYDFENKVLHANVDVYAQLAGGLIRGRASGNRAGWAVMHFSPDEWYVHLGTPADRLGLKMAIGPISAEAGGYFMVGSHIPESPPPPKAVADILGVQLSELDYMRDLNALGEGKGFAFGADFSINTGDLRFLMFYASFQAGLGFDIMLKDYGDAGCAGRSGPIGMNGWYANGQAYAYLQGELGIQVKVMMVRKRIPIVKAGAAVLLQAKLPNPSWFRGYVAGHFNVLGGLIKGKFRFKVTIGEECEEINSSPLDDIKVIADFSPADKATQVDVFAAPQAVFNMPIEKPFTIDDDQGAKTYRIKLEELKISNDGQPIPGTLRWNALGDAVFFESTEILPPNASIKAIVKVRFEQQAGSTWQPVYDNGQPAVEQKEITFTTGTAPETIPLTNIAYSYPVVDQKYFYAKQYNKGYIQLKRGQAYLFNTGMYQQKAVFAGDNGNEENVSFSYDSVLRRVKLDLPELVTSQRYICSLLGFPSQGGAGQTKQSIQNVTADENDIQIASNQASGIAISSKPRLFLSYAFSSSRYLTFQEKMMTKTMQRPLYEIVLSDVGSLQADVNGEEAFDISELNGTVYTDNLPLIQPVAQLNDGWFLQQIKPLIYDGYPLQPAITVNRDTTVVGFPPSRGVEPMSWYLESAATTSMNRMLTARFPYKYYQGYYYKQDFTDLQYKAVNQFVAYPASLSRGLQRFITGIFPVMLPGKYKVSYWYILPGNIQSGEQEFDFENP